MEAPCGDFATHFFCHLCAIWQEYREIRERAGDSKPPDLKLAVVTPPAVQNGIIRSLVIKRYCCYISFLCSTCFRVVLLLSLLLKLLGYILIFCLTFKTIMREGFNPILDCMTTHACK